MHLTPHHRRLRDADEVAAAFHDLGVDCLQLSHAEGASHLATAKFAGIQLRTMALAGALRFRGTVPADQVAVQIDLGSAPGRRVHGKPLGYNDLVVAWDSTGFEFVSAIQHRGMTLAVPAQVIMDAIEQREPASEALPRATRLHVLAGDAARTARIRQLAEQIFSLSGQRVDTRLAEFVSSSMFDAVTGTLLAPGHRLHWKGYRVPHYQRLPIVRRAEEFLRTHLGDPIMLHDICRAARASERTVAYAFRDVYGMGAMRYLKMLRLDRVRRELKALPEEAGSATDIGRRCGLWHAGHFFTDYRMLFGETPQQTRSMGYLGLPDLQAVSRRPSVVRPVPPQDNAGASLHD